METVAQIAALIIVGLANIGGLFSLAAFIFTND